jgi:hypothetical protein
VQNLPPKQRSNKNKKCGNRLNAAPDFKIQDWSIKSNMTRICEEGNKKSSK